MTFRAAAVLVAVILCAPATAGGQVTGAGAESFSGRVDQLEISGLWRTEEQIVRNELGWSVPGTVDAATWKLGIARLWNCGLFSKVAAHLETRAGRQIAVVELEERWTINPLFSFQIVKQRNGPGSTWWSAGVSDLNVGGKFVEAAATYEQFNGQAGGLAFVRAHRFLGRRMDATVQWESLVRPRIGFADRRQRLRFEVNQLAMDDELRFGGRLDLQRDGIFDAGDGDPHLPASSRAAVVDVGARYGRIDVVRIRQTGTSMELRGAAGLDQPDGGSAALYGHAWAQVLWFSAVGDRWNLAGRLQTAVQTQAPPQMQFFLGGLSEVRGVRDSYLRGDRYAFANVEARWTFLDSTWLAVVPTVFVDAAVARDAERGNVALATCGGGARFLVPRFVRTGLRADVAFPIVGGACGSVTSHLQCAAASFGVFQFF